MSIFNDNVTNEVPVIYKVTLALQDIVDAVGRAVDPHPILADDGEHGDAEQHADDPADDPGDRQDASLYDEIVFPLFAVTVSALSVTVKF